MPRVPTYDGPQVTPQAGRAPSSTINFGPGAYGAGLSASAGALSKQLFKVQMEKAQELATTDAAEAVNIFQRGMVDIRNEQFAKQLNQAKGATEEALGAREKLAKDVQKNIQTPHGNLIFQRMLESSFEGDIGPIQGHEAEQQAKYKDVSLGMVLAGELEKAVVNNKPVDPKSMATIEANVAATTRALWTGKLEGSQLDQKAAEAVSALHINNLKRIADPELAQAYYVANQSKIISTDETAAFARELSVSTRIYTAQQLAVQANDIALTHGEVAARDWIMARPELQGVENQKTMDETFKRFDYQRNAFQAAKKSDDDSYNLSMWKVFERNGERAGLFTAEQRARLGPFLQSYENIENSNIARAKALRDSSGMPSAEELAGSEELRQLGKTFSEDPDKFNDKAFFNEALHRAGPLWKTVIGWQQASLKPSSALVVDNPHALPEIRKAAFDAGLIRKASGVLKPEDQTKLDELVPAIDAAMQQWAVDNKGKKPLASDFEREARTALTKIPVRGAFFGLFPDRHEYTFQHPELPQPSSTTIERSRFSTAFRFSYTQKFNRPPQDFFVEEQYRAWVSAGRPPIDFLTKPQMIQQGIDDSIRMKGGK